MKKITLLFLVFILPILHFMGNDAFAQTVSGVTSNTGCLNSGTVTASSTGLETTPQYQLLLQSGEVVAPLAGDANQFTNNPVFTGLATGTYIVKGRAIGGGTIYSSSIISVTDGYGAMAVATATMTTGCAANGTAALNSSLTGGRAPFTYRIATQAAPTTYLETSASTIAPSYTFAALPANTYLVSVTDACGQTVTGATSISNPTVAIADIRNNSFNYLNYTTGGVGNCGTPDTPSPLSMVIQAGWVYTTGGASVSPADAALFTWKIKYRGMLYGLDTTGDMAADANGAGIPLTSIQYRMPLAATRDDIITNDAYADMSVVLSDLCGNTREFSVRDYNAVSSQIVSASGCNDTPTIQALLGAGMACFPIAVTFTNSTNPADVTTLNVTANNQNIPAPGLIPGRAYNLTYLDAAGYTGNRVFATTSLTVSSNSAVSISQYFRPGNSKNLDRLNYGRADLRITPIQAGDNVTYTVTASSNLFGTCRLYPITVSP
jgi:hypothetical protein